MEEGEVVQQKDIQHYSASVTAWFDSALEHDKSLLTLAAGGIGLLLTLLTTVGVSSCVALVLYALAIAAFLTTIVCVLFIFKRNKTHIEEVIHGARIGGDRVLTILDVVASISFGFGALLAAVIGVVSATSSFTNRSIEMSNKERIDILESMNNLTRLQVSAPTEIKSFSGASRLRIDQPISTQPVTPATTAKLEVPAAVSTPTPAAPATHDSNKSG
jgi:hypothetical protein